MYASNYGQELKERLRRMQILEEEEFRHAWPRSGSTSSSSSTSGKHNRKDPVSKKEQTGANKKTSQQKEDSQSQIPTSKHDEILKWSKTIPQTLDVEQKFKASPKGGSSVKLFFLANDGNLFDGGTSNLGRQGLKTSTPFGRMCRSANPRLSNRGSIGYAHGGRPPPVPISKKIPSHNLKETEKDSKLPIHVLQNTTNNLVDSSLFYSGERQSLHTPQARSGATPKSASRKDPRDLPSVEQGMTGDHAQLTFRSRPPSTLERQRQLRQSSGVVRPWTTSGRIGEHTECKRSLSNSLLNVLTIDDCQLRHMYRERERDRLGSSHGAQRCVSTAFPRSRPQSSRTESGIYDLQSILSGSARKHPQRQMVRTAEEELEHALENPDRDLTLPPELLILLEDHVDYPSEAVRKGFEALLDKDVMNNTCRTGLYRYDKSSKLKTDVGKGTNLFLRMKAMLRYHMLVDQNMPSRVRMNKALRMHLGDRNQESIYGSDSGRLDHLAEASDGTD